MPSNYQQPTNGPRPYDPSTSESSGRLGAKAHETTEKLKETAVERVGEARQMADAQKEQLADRVRRVGSAVREAGDKLRDEDQFLGRYAGVAADGIERAASYLSTADPKAAIQDVEAFARKKPALFFGGAFLIGLAAGRFLKSSQHRESDQGPDWPSGGYGAGDSGGYPSERAEPYPSTGIGAAGTEGIFNPPEEPNIGTTPTDPGIGNTSRDTGGGGSREKG